MPKHPDQLRRELAPLFEDVVRSMRELLIEIDRAESIGGLRDSHAREASMRAWGRAGEWLVAAYGTEGAK